MALSSRKTTFVLLGEKAVHVVLKVVPIGGMCLGIEWLWSVRVLVIDLLVVRFYIGNPKRV